MWTDSASCRVNKMRCCALVTSERSSRDLFRLRGIKDVPRAVHTVGTEVNHPSIVVCQFQVLGSDFLLSVLSRMNHQLDNGGSMLHSV